jgi:hypothetical protein
VELRDEIYVMGERCQQATVGEGGVLNLSSHWHRRQIRGGR